ncbi:MAG: alpha/beta hydrolase [Bacteroidota bacterium]
MSKVSILTIFFAVTASSNFAQILIPLYADKIPNSKPSPDEETTEQRDGITIVSKISIPALSIFLPPKGKANGTAIIICPGGGYWVNAISHEGTEVAKKFTEMGIAAFVLKYRIPNEATMENREIGPLQDAQQAIKTVRQRAKEWNVNVNRIGIMGFSAGGHLASTTATHFTQAMIREAGNISLRPDFMILIYPVISFQDAIGHIGSRDQLLGKHPTVEKINQYSNELQVTAQTPPTFLVHASDDDVVNPDNSIAFYQSLTKNKVPAELHLYQKGGHGFGMNNKTTGDQWMDRCKNWLKANGLLN